MSSKVHSDFVELAAGRVMYCAAGVCASVKVFQLSVADVGVIVSTAIVVLSFVVQTYFRVKSDRREQLRSEHDAD